MLHALRAGLSAVAVAAALPALIPVGPAFAQAAPPSPGTGPYPALSEPAPGLPTHSLYRPRDLDALKGAKLPIVAWANGGCANSNSNFRVFLTEIASHGYLIVAIGPWTDAPPARSAEPAAGPAPGPSPGPGPGDDPTRSSQLIDAIAWAQAENARPDSPLQGRLAVDEIAVAGQSCGGLQALDVSPDPRIRTSLIFNSGIYTRPGGRSGIRVSKDKLGQLHAPIAYLIGGPADIAYPNATDDFARIDRVPAVIANISLGHSGNYGLPLGGPFAPVAVAWLDWQLKGDQTAKAVFAGSRCGLCGDPAWTVRSKGLEGMR